MLLVETLIREVHEQYGSDGLFEAIDWIEKISGRESRSKHITPREDADWLLMSNAIEEATHIIHGG